MKAFILISLLNLVSCASNSYQAKKQRIDDQIWQCKELCSAGTIDIARIEGLRCMCSKQAQAPVINNIMPAPQAQPVVIYQSREPSRAPAVEQQVQSLPQNYGGTQIQSLNGTNIISRRK